MSKSTVTPAKPAVTVSAGAGANKWTLTKEDKATLDGVVKSVVEADASVTMAQGVLVWRQANAVLVAEDLGCFGEGRLYPRRKDYASRILVSESRMSGLGTLAKAIRLGLAEGDPNTSVLSSNAGVKAVKDAKTLPAMIREARKAAKAKADERAKATAAAKANREGRPNDGTDKEETPEETPAVVVLSSLESIVAAVVGLDEAFKRGGIGSPAKDALTQEQYADAKARLLRILKREDTHAAKVAAEAAKATA
jgi:hypothetical protein